MNPLILALLIGQIVSTPPGIGVQDEGVSQGRAQTVNCTGAGVTCSVSGSVATLNASGGAGSANVVAVTLDFTVNGDESALAVVVGQAWVTATSVIVCAPTLVSTASRAEGAEDALIEGLTVAIYNRVNGTGFTIRSWVRFGKAYGQFTFHCTGA